MFSSQQFFMGHNNCTAVLCWVVSFYISLLWSYSYYLSSQICDKNTPQQLYSGQSFTSRSNYYPEHWFLASNLKKSYFLNYFPFSSLFCAKLLLNFGTIAVWSQTSSGHLFLVPKLKEHLYFRQYTIPSFVHHSAKIPPYHS